jgi:hypothetical protein
MQFPVAQTVFVAASVIFSVSLSGAQTGVIEPDRPASDITGARHPALPVFTMQQRAALYSAVVKAQLPAALPLEMQVKIGTKLPDSPQVQALPEAARSQVPAAKNYKFAIWRDQVLLVDHNNTVADILHGDVLKEYTRSQ